ncbi:MAG: hypothetical protein QNJ54_13485 [Prochloraceae cyanobacterium]|nr:hypothetical protein [Prochloraceae cyanobacterium]
MNFYYIYRFVILGVTLYGFFQFVGSLLQYKPYYDRFPVWMQKYIFRHGGKLLQTKLAEHRRDFIINGFLLIILLFLDAIVFIY